MINEVQVVSFALAFENNWQLLTQQLEMSAMDQLIRAMRPAINPIGK